ncbi:MAG: bifunctional DNA primase/helicase [Rickettsiales bacterium]|nr:bifunctional DNA primase/helicase [Rickettsiales bacterium]
MNTTEINGFEIDNFNQYDLDVGKREGICPLCSHTRQPKNQKAKCAMYDWERGLGTCMNCNEVFQLHTFKRQSNNIKEYTKPEWKNNTTLSDNVIKWFEGRSISQKTLVKMKITEGIEFMPQTGKSENTIQFNYFINNELINIKYRDGRKNFKLVKGAEKVFYNIDRTIGHDYVVIVEGEMDALSFVESGIESVVSVPNGATINNTNLDYLDSCIDYFESKEKVILAVDADEAGLALKQELIRRLGAERCFTVEFGTYKDANEFLVAHGRSMLADVITKAKPVPIENVVTLKDINDELEEFIYEGFKPGYQIGLNNFDSIFSTYTGQFITVTGVPSSGKSDFVDRMVVGYYLKYGWKTAFASPENKPTFLHTHKLIRKLGGWMPSKDDIGTDRWNNIISKVNDNFYFIENERYDLDAVLAKGAELVKRKGIKCLVVDPYNKVKMQGASSMSIPDATMEYLTRIEAFAKKYDVLVIIVAHPTKMYKKEDGTIDEPTMYSIKGGGEWYDASYHGLLVHRNYEQKTVKVKVLKVKFQNLGENQAEAHFKWDHISGDYMPIEETNVNAMPWEVD